MIHFYYYFKKRSIALETEERVKLIQNNDYQTEKLNIKKEKNTSAEVGPRYTLRLKSVTRRVFTVARTIYPKRRRPVEVTKVLISLFTHI